MDSNSLFNAFIKRTSKRVQDMNKTISEMKELSSSPFEHNEIVNVHVETMKMSLASELRALIYSLKSLDFIPESLDSSFSIEFEDGACEILFDPELNEHLNISTPLVIEGTEEERQHKADLVFSLHSFEGEKDFILHLEKEREERFLGVILPEYNPSFQPFKVESGEDVQADVGHRPIQIRKEKDGVWSNYWAGYDKEGNVVEEGVVGFWYRLFTRIFMGIEWVKF